MVVTFVGNRQTVSSKSTVTLENVSGRSPLLLSNNLVSGFKAIYELAVPRSIRQGNQFMSGRVTPTSLTGKSEINMVFPGQLKTGTYKFGLTVSVCPSSGCTVENRIVRTTPVTVIVQNVTPKFNE
jgi:hypothetical protein